MKPANREKRVWYYVRLMFGWGTPGLKYIPNKDPRYVMTQIACNVLRYLTPSPIDVPEGFDLKEKVEFQKIFILPGKEYIVDETCAVLNAVPNLYELYVEVKGVMDIPRTIENVHNACPQLGLL